MELLNSVLIPNILSYEKVLVDFDGIKDLKLTYPKVRKKKDYYLAYMPDIEKKIDALTFYYLVRLFYKKTIFYFVEKQEDKFLVFGGHTFEINETTFFYKEFFVDEIDELKDIDILNKKFLNTDKCMVFFINVDDNDKKYILDLLDAKKGDEKKILSFIFMSGIKNYMFAIGALIISAGIFFGINYYLNLKKDEIMQKQESITEEYNIKANNVKKRIKKLEKGLDELKISKNMKIYKG